MKRNIAAAVFPLLIMPFHASAEVPSGTILSPDSVSTDSVPDSFGRMIRDGVALKEVVVNGNHGSKERQMRSSLNTIAVGRNFIAENFGGSLMQTLARLPGVKAMNVGSGESKPVIRGLGFNRIVVAENGIKHEGQQWGDDHGLEADQFSTDNVEVVKGPSALVYGSDAIGGVLDLRSDAVPEKRFGGSVNVFARSNNESAGTHVGIGGRNGKFWYKANATLIDYADYKVPADSIQYYSYYIKLKDRRLRNTAGREYDGNIMLGYIGGRLRSYVRVSDINMKSGFFANAHGLEVLMSDIDYDRSRRDIDLPYHTVNHFSVSNHTDYSWRKGLVEGDFGYQNNSQRELSEPISHGYMPVPPNTLERSFIKQTFSANVSTRLILGRHSFHAGAGVEYQHNRRGGWGFILPDFEQFSAGAYAFDRFVVSDKLVLSAGVRFDHGVVDVHSYHDWYKTPVNGDSVYVERSGNISRTFNSLTWSVGVNRETGDFVLKANIGKSFRMPAAKELGMDGINYNIFRYEKGNSSLSPEESYQADAGIVYEHEKICFTLTPYINYFPNYIYLNPTSEYREGLQLYYYTQSRVLRWGFEGEFTYKILPVLEFTAGGEYLHARQLSGEKKGYTLPFSTPWSARGELKYTLPSGDEGTGGYASVGCTVTGAQNEVVPPEEPTPGHWLLDASVEKSFRIGKNVISIILNGENLLGKRYFDHTSYYRLIGVPEPGRNFSLMTSFKF